MSTLGLVYVRSPAVTMPTCYLCVISCSCDAAIIICHVAGRILRCCCRSKSIWSNSDGRHSRRYICNGTRWTAVCTACLRTTR